jgi:hypothetical protein
LRVDTVNAVLYFEDTGDLSKFTTDPNITTPMLPGKDFNRQIAIADIQAVNGQHVMGVHTRTGRTLVFGRRLLPARRSLTLSGMPQVRLPLKS